MIVTYGLKQLIVAQVKNWSIGYPLNLLMKRRPFMHDPSCQHSFQALPWAWRGVRVSDC
jgi:hypothetical protein